MSYQDNITVSVNRALKSKLLRESKAVSKEAANNQRSNMEFTNKRRQHGPKDYLLQRILNIHNDTGSNYYESNY